MADRVTLTIGTRKGVFVAEAAKPRRSFTLGGPFGAGVPVYATLIDTRGHAPPLRVELQSVLRHEGVAVDGLGKTFEETKSAPAFPKDDGRALANIGSLEAGTGKKDLWCGVELAAFLEAHPDSRPGAHFRVARVSGKGTGRVDIVGVAALVGAKRSTTKARASRANGQLGGRPPKTATSSARLRKTAG